MQSSKYLLVYDADCGPCTKFKDAADFLDTYGRLDFVSLIEADELGLLDKIPASLRHRSFHLISPNWDIQGGASALPSLIELFPSGRLISKLITSAPGGRRLLASVYSTFSRLHDSGSCRYGSALT